MRENKTKTCYTSRSILGMLPPGFLLQPTDHVFLDSSDLSTVGLDLGFPIGMAVHTRSAPRSVRVDLASEFNVFILRCDSLMWPSLNCQDLEGYAKAGIVRRNFASRGLLCERNQTCEVSSLTEGGEVLDSAIDGIRVQYHHYYVRCAKGDLG